MIKPIPAIHRPIIMIIMFPKAFYSKPSLTTYANFPVPYMFGCEIDMNLWRFAIFVPSKNVLKFSG